MSDVWCDDKLGYKDIGDAFTKLVKSIDTAHVISVEAGFGRGKTFFRTHWAQQLVAADELVVEIDLQQSDHTGDPVVTLLGALVAQVPPGDKARGKKVLETAAKIAGVGARTVARALLREGAEELIDATTAGAIEKLGDFDALDDVISGLGDGMSKAASQMIATQMAVEQVRTKELPDQLKALHEALTKGRENKRVIVILDELDRCHPDYAIAVLEAMKLVFHQDGFVFCLMVNAEYTENLAQHRFGKANDDERYLDKFVDLRLKLKPVEDALKAAVTEMAIELPLKIPFADGGEFSIDKAASLAGELAIQSGLGMRKIKRLLLKVELALRCYEKQPIDAPLLVFLAFQNDKPDSIKTDSLPRTQFTPELAEKLMSEFNGTPERGDRRERAERLFYQKMREIFVEYEAVPQERFRTPDDAKDYYEWANFLKYLAPYYIPDHQDMLDSVANFTDD